MPTGSDKITTTTTTTTSNNSIHNNNDKIITTINQENDTIDTIGTNGATNESNNEINCGTKLPTGTYDPTPYIQRARVTRPAPPKPSCNPMQFVQIKPCNLYQSAQDQLKRAEEVKKVKEIKKEDAEDWQNNLDNWKSSRRKRVEHIIDRVVEVKKLELEEHDRQRRKSKTFSEMLEERGERKGRSNKLASLTVYTEDEANDLSDLGIGTSSTSGKSSLSEDYDNHSVMSDNVDTEKQNFGDIDNNSNNDGEIGETIRDYISSPGYDTSSSTAPASSPDPCEYTYEGAIQDYKTRVSRATTGGASTSSATATTNYINGSNNGFRSNISSPYSKDSTPERTTIINDNNINQYLPRRMSGSKIEDRLMNFEVKSSNDINETLSSTSSLVSKKDLPKVDILKRRELFEKDKINNMSQQKRFSGDFSNTKSIRERLSSLEKKIDDPPSITVSSNIINKNKNRILNNDINNIKDRLQQNHDIKQENNIIEIDDNNILSSIDHNNINDNKITPVKISIKDRLSSLQNAVTKEEIKKPIMLVDEHQLELLKKEDFNNKQAAAAAVAASAMAESLKVIENINLNNSHELLNIQDESNIDTDREDSGIHTTDVSCSVSQTDEQPELVNEDSHHHNDDNNHHINIDALCDTTISSLPTNNDETMKENININVGVVVDELKNDKLIEPILQSPSSIYHDDSIEDISTSSTIMTPSEEQIADLESSVNEAIELALNAIDQEEITCDETLITNHNENLNKTDEQQVNHHHHQQHQENIDMINVNKINQKSEPIYENIDEKCVTEELNIKIKENHHHHQPIIKITENINSLIIEEQQQQPKKSLFVQSETIKTIPTLPPTAQVRKSLTNLQHQKQTTNLIQKTISNNENNIKQQQITDVEEPYYQVPKSSEPYYEVPKSNQRIPVYENIELFYNGCQLIDGTSLINTSIPPMILQPPKEKPPPPPIDDTDDNNEDFCENTYEIINNKTSSSSSLLFKNHNSTNVFNEQKKQDDQRLVIIDNNKPIKRMNSTKRIKKEIRNKRSSFLGIEGTNDDDSFLEFSVAPPPDMIKLLQEERRLEKQLYMKAGLYDSSDTGESRDSGVSENHSRQSSEPFTNSSEEHVDLLKKKEKEIIEVLEKEEEKQKQQQQSEEINNWENQQQQHQESNKSNVKMQCIEEQIREQEEVLRVERELLQLEQEELKRQRENLMLRENLARRELEHGAKMLMSANRRSLQDINNVVPTIPFPVPKQQSSSTQHQPAMINHYANVPNQIYQVQTDYRKSLSDLQDYNPSKRLSTAPAPPAKPLRSNLSLDNSNRSINYNVSVPGGGLVKIANQSIISPVVTTSSLNSIHHSQSIDEYVPVRNNYQSNTALYNCGNMSRNTLLALSATPKPKFTDAWVQSTKKIPATATEKAHESWLYQQKRKSVPEGFNYNKHWLIQEAEQRRIDQQRGLIRTNGNNNNNVTGVWNGTTNTTIQKNSNNKPLPDAVIQTLTQRVQSKGIGERKRLEARSTDSLLSTFSQSNPILNSPLSTEDGYHQDKILSVSGKKKCSHCGDELGRGAAMIIESLRLFYHINCFKCCVCHVQLGDGLNGTDVRVRNHKLHCHNCYSSDDGIKFSCV